jgi:hypothetical protein
MLKFFFFFFWRELALYAFVVIPWFLFNRLLLPLSDISDERTRLYLHQKVAFRQMALPEIRL